MNIINGSYFPWPVKIIGVFLILASIPNITTAPLLATLLLLGGAIIFTTHYGFKIDVAKSSYKEYTWFLGWKNGEEIKFNRIEYLFIKSNKVSRTYNSLLSSTTIGDLEYNGYLKVSESEKILIASSKNKKEVVARLENLKRYLNTSILDYTVEVPGQM